jgi:hypothetical protein
MKVFLIILFLCSVPLFGTSYRKGYVVFVEDKVTKNIPIIVSIYDYPPIIQAEMSGNSIIHFKVPKSKIPSKFTNKESIKLNLSFTFKSESLSGLKLELVSIGNNFEGVFRISRELVKTCTVLFKMNHMHGKSEKENLFKVRLNSFKILPFESFKKLPKKSIEKLSSILAIHGFGYRND